MSASIHTVLISAATHGNEMSGIAAVKRWQQNSTPLNHLAPSIEIELSLLNQQAMQLNTRFVEQDLNRQFSHAALSNNKNSTVYEHTLAQSYNQQFGPKGDSRTDFIIDIHNTTSNMGPTLIILVNDEFHQQLARFVKIRMPEAVILVEDYQDYDDFAYFCTLGKKGIMIEVGPQPQGILKAVAYQQTVAMTHAILEFIEQYNQQGLPQLQPTEAFRLGKEVSFPTTEQNGVTEKLAMLHPNIEGKDFQLMAKGTACFVDFDGKDILWDEEDTYPHFIGESAYNHLHLAFATANKCLF